MCTDVAFVVAHLRSVRSPSNSESGDATNSSITGGGKFTRTSTLAPTDSPFRPSARRVNTVWSSIESVSMVPSGFGLSLTRSGAPCGAIRTFAVRTTFQDSVVFAPGSTRRSAAVKATISGPAGSPVPDEHAARKRVAAAVQRLRRTWCSTPR